MGQDQQKAISMETTDPAEGIAWQADHARNNSAPITGKVIEALLPLLNGETAVGRRMANWQGKVLESAMPLRLAGGLHWLHLSGADARLGPVYADEVAEQAAIDAIVGAVVADHDAALLPWFDGPPQTNEAGRSSAIMAGLLWLSGRVGPKFELLEIGSSAGANTMIERYAYDLGGVRVGPEQSPVLIRPEWRGAPPPRAPVEIVSIRGCDVAPIDLSDDAAALRLKSYVWAEMTARLERLDAIIALARQQPPRIDRADAADWVEARLAEPQAEGVTRVLYHSIVWQYLPEAGRARIEAAMAQAAARATPERPLAWIMLETNRATFRHELRVRYWPGGDEAALLGQAHAHGLWVEWLDQG
ncbi:DUF2332 domain-containing protein [Novosphingobium flavum]|uniref:DUF2332 domain-containing protein n=1 Tax=Novosphingobium flavum TaxID=1778672 RepID=A0A7X1KKJ6_9SPHN|nr:DUF2332 domain-containing protein [Novosphingobium flavum]MBC2664260.1 DUF2332 domain-containing protein [Novosphingobium flavum]